MKAVEDMQRLGTFLADHVQVGLPHVRADKLDLRSQLLSDAAVSAMDAPHPVEKVNQNSPERDELKTPLGKMIVTGRGLVAPRADCRRTLSRPDVHFDAFLAGAEAGVSVDESPMAMAVV